MIAIASHVRVWLAAGHTDMRKGMNGLALLVQEALKRDPHVGDLYVFRGRRGDLIKIVWHDGIGLSLYAKRLDRGRFVWPATAGATSSRPRRRLMRGTFRPMAGARTRGEGPAAVQAGPQPLPRRCR